MTFTRTGVFATPVEVQKVKDAWRPGVFMGGPLGHSTGADESARMVQIYALEHGLADMKDHTYGLDPVTGEFLAP